jgi:hypothetical protein
MKPVHECLVLKAIIEDKDFINFVFENKIEREIDFFKIFHVNRVSGVDIGNHYQSLVSWKPLSNIRPIL